MRVKFIKEIRFNNFKRYKSFIYSARENRNIFIGDNEAGKSTILQAIDIVLRGSRAKVESLGLETLFNIDVINNFLSSNKNLEELPELTIEIFLNDHGNINLEGLNHSGDKVCHGMKLTCKPLIDDYGIEIKSALEVESPLFPFEYYSIKFETFAGQSYTQNRRFLNHILIDSSLIGTEFATRQYTKSLYETHTDLTQRHNHNHAFRQSKSTFRESELKTLNQNVGDYIFDLQTDTSSSLEHNLMIMDKGVAISQMGKGKQCFIKTEFALKQKEGGSPIDLILIEEPENHLSHLNMKKLINRIEESTKTQAFIATHSNSVCSRLDLHNASLLTASANKPISLKDLPNSTANYFIKAPDNKILEFILSESVVLVEGDAEFMLVDGFYEKLFGDKLENSNIHVISVGGTSFKRYLDLAKLLNIKTAVIRDNDKDFNKNCIENYTDYVSDIIKIFYDEDNTNRTTLEKCLYLDNTLLCDELFKPGRKTLTVQEYMLKNKADVAFNLLLEAMPRLIAPDYIERALRWIKE